MEKIKPILQERIGMVSASLFKREVEGINGIFPSFSVALQRSYKDKNGDGFHQDTLTLSKSQLKSVIAVLSRIDASLN